MDYDTRSQVFDRCIASANAPLAGAINGLEQYLALGIAPQKLILGVPWYGYVYPCLDTPDPLATFCPIKGKVGAPSVPLRFFVPKARR